MKRVKGIAVFLGVAMIVTVAGAAILAPRNPSSGGGEGGLTCPRGTVPVLSGGALAPGAFDRPGVPADPVAALEAYVGAARVAVESGLVDNPEAYRSLVTSRFTSLPEDGGIVTFVGRDPDGVVISVVDAVRGGTQDGWLVRGDTSCRADG